MQRLRDTLRRKPKGSRPKTESAENPTILTLDIPSSGRQVRSASFEELRIDKKGNPESGKDVEEPGSDHDGNTLDVPSPARSSRSRSFDAATSKECGPPSRGRSTSGSVSLLEIPKWKLLIRRASSTSSGRGSPTGDPSDKCVHCSLLMELQLNEGGDVSPPCSARSSLSSQGSSYGPDSDADISDGNNGRGSGYEGDEDEEALFSMALRLNQLDIDPGDECLVAPVEESLPLVTLRAAPERKDSGPFLVEEDLGNGITVISLEVPVSKQTRSASIDASFLKVPERPDLIASGDEPQPKTQRSHSVDIALPLKPNGPYLVVPTQRQAVLFQKKAIQGEIKISTENGETRTLRSAPDWGETAINGDHLWVSTSASGDLCYVGESECSKQGPRLCCPVCKITAHTGCIGILIDKIKFHCKPTFKDVGVRQYREQTVIPHHWVHRRHQKGRCKQCGKSFQSKLSFGNKEIVALSCSWCKTAFHNKETCFSMERLSEMCKLGMHGDLIVPPSWIVKLPRKGSFKSSIRRSPKSKRSSSKRRAKKEDQTTATSTELTHHLPVHHSLHHMHGTSSSSPPPPPPTPEVKGAPLLPPGPVGPHRSFAIKPIPSSTTRPLLVFINPKSGGNQGAKLIQKFQWLLNPRQVFDLNQGGPRPGLELYKKVQNLRILACGGDGTAGWILSVLDEIGMSPPPPLSVLPLGTGNDLARALGWGGGYTDEPVSKILLNIKDGEVVQLDRWDLKVERYLELSPAELTADAPEGGKESLPLNVVNNYFSIGVDAHIALEFHEAREAHPEKFNSRLRNKMFYGQAGGKDLLQRKWKDLCTFITLECDGVDLTQRLKDLRVHSLLFLNIASYSGGTRPWGTNSPSYETPRTDDGLIEVIGLTTYQLPLLQAGGHGSCIAQCKSAKIITSRTIPMQVDGEPCRLLPSVISLQLRNKANMIAKAKSHTLPAHVPTIEMVTLGVRKLNLNDYETYHYEKDKLKEFSNPLGLLTIKPDLELDHVRSQINQMSQVKDKHHHLVGVEAGCYDNEVKRYRIEKTFNLSADWCFVDSCTAERFFRIDRAQEHLHYVVDICNDDLFILDPADESNKEDNVTNCCISEDEGRLETVSRSSLAAPSLGENNNNTILLLKTDESQEQMVASEGKECEEKEEENGNRKSIREEGEEEDKKIKGNLLEGPSDVCKGGQEKKEETSASSEKLLPTGNDCLELLEAAKVGDLEGIKKLHEEGFNLIVSDEKGKTALHFAAMLGFEDVVQFLIKEAPVLMEITDSEEGQTALHEAAKCRRQRICGMLAVAGCCLTKTDNQGMTAKQLALRSGDEHLSAYLEHFERYQNILKDRETTL